jgi:type I restriction enzyme S subunit
MTEKKTNKQPKTDVPNLRFPRFEEPWVKARLEDVTEKINSGKTPLGGETNYLTRGIPFIRSQNVNNDQLELENIVYISKDVNAVMKNSVVRANDILLNITGASLGRSCVVPKDFEVGNVNQHVCIIRVKKEYNPRFVQPILASARGKALFESLQTGSGREGLNFESIKKIVLDFPSLPEQDKIANLLSLINRRIQTQNKIIEGLKQLKTLVSKKIFSQQLRFNDEHGNEFPEWEIKKMGDVAKIYDGTHQTPNYVDAGIPFYSVEHLTANQFSNTKFVSTEVYNKENKRVKLERGDILMTRIGSIGVAKYIDWDVKASFYVSLALIKNSDKVNNKFLCHFINTDFFQAELWKRTIHVAFPKKINLGEISECQIKVPNISEQNKVADLLSKIEHKFEIEIKLLKQFESQKQYIQSNVFI